MQFFQHHFRDLTVLRVFLAPRRISSFVQTSRPGGRSAQAAPTRQENALSDTLQYS
jgi:hypothetical protein